MAESLPKLFFTARRTGTALVAIHSADAAETIQGLLDAGALRALRARPAEPPKDGQGAEPKSPQQAFVFRWDVQNGLVGITKDARAVLGHLAAQAAQEAAKEAGDESPVPPVDVGAMTGGFAGMTHFCRRLPPDSVVFCLNAHRALQGEGQEVAQAVQGVWNLRDTFKQNFRTLVLLGPVLELPEELTQDVMVFEEGAPDEDRLAGIVKERLTANKLPELGPTELRRAVVALRGLAAYPAEQAVAMSVSKAGLDLGGLWERKKTTISQVHGLSVLRGSDRFDEIRDLDALVGFCQRLQAGPQPLSVIVQIEEFEKQMAGSQSEGGDNTGVSQDRLSVLLDSMEENNWTGFICYGVPGAGKSKIIKAFANESGALPVKLDLGALSHRYVGTSEARVRLAMQTLLGAGGRGGVLFAASCNKITGALPPELRRRFRMGIWFFDLPSAEGLVQIWEVHLKAYGLPADAPLPESTGWTGANVRDCCDIAQRLACTPREAAQFIVPVIKSDPKAVQQARAIAEGSFLCARRGGHYTRPEAHEDEQTGAREVLL